MAITPKVSELMISGARVFRAPTGTTIPAKTLAAYAAWPVGWEELGLTSAPLIMSYEATIAEASEIQQALGVVDRAKASEAWKMETRLAQVKNAEAQNLASGGGGTIATVAAGVGVPGSQEFKTGGNRFMTKYMYGFEGEHLEDSTGIVLPVRGVFYLATVMPGWSMQFDKTKYAEGFPLPIGALEDVTRTRGDRVYCYYFVHQSPTG